MMKLTKLLIVIPLPPHIPEHPPSLTPQSVHKGDIVQILDVKLTVHFQCSS